MNNEEKNETKGEKSSLSALVCKDPNYINGKPSHKFLCEFEQSILNFASKNPADIKDVFGNWFGRMIGFGYEFIAPGNSFQEQNNAVSGRNTDVFRQKLRNREIWIEEWKTDFGSVKELGNNMFSANIRIVTGGDLQLNRDYNVKFTVQNADLEAKKIEIG